MRNILVVIFIFFSFYFANSAPKQIQAVLSYSAFNSPSDGPYIETYLAVSNNSCIYKKNNSGNFQANVNVTIIFRQDTVIKHFKKYNLFSPEVTDTSSLADNFVDVQRFLLPDGKYEMELKLTDNNNPNKTIQSKEKITVSFPSKSLSISDIQLVDSYIKSREQNILSKSGFDIVPHVMNFYSRSQNFMKFYAEVYNASLVFGEGSKYLIKYYIESTQTSLPVDGFIRINKEISKPVNVILSEFDISVLPSGNYNIVLEARDNEDKIVVLSSLFFQRSNPDFKYKPVDTLSFDVENSFAGKLNDIKQLNDYIESLYPISSNLEYQYTQNQLKNAKLKTKQLYFYNFWNNRNRNNPEKAWLDYLEEVKKVNAAYSTRIKRGYLTERGRVYLQYGPPNTIYGNDYEPSAYPYEIWHYYTLKNQRNKKFVFYCPDIVTNDYQLLTSDAEGEINNPQWQIVLYKRTTPTNSIDEQFPTKHYGGQAEDYYRLPR
jgi:GWxTD domain-containing protein